MVKVYFDYVILFDEIGSEIRKVGEERERSTLGRVGLGPCLPWRNEHIRYVNCGMITKRREDCIKRWEDYAGLSGIVRLRWTNYLRADTFTD